jgi:hypothetical protein
MVMNLMPWRKKKESEVEMWRPHRYEDPTYDLTRGMSDMVDHFFRRFASIWTVRCSGITSDSAACPASTLPKPEKM